MDLYLLRLLFIHQVCLTLRDILYLVSRYRVTEVMNISKLVANVTLALITLVPRLIVQPANQGGMHGMQVSGNKEKRHCIILMAH